MKSRYSYVVYTHKKYFMPLHIVEISCPLLVGCAVFSSARDAQEYIKHEKEDLQRRGFNLEYDADLVACPEVVNDVRNGERIFSLLRNKQIYCCG